MVGGQRLGIGHVEHRSGQATAVERLDQRSLIKLWSAAHVEQPRPMRQRGEKAGVQNAARLVRERQQTNKDVCAPQEIGKLIRAMKTGDVFDLLSAAAPSGEWELERLQALDGRM